MALNAGFLDIEVRFAMDLKDTNLICRLDPYCVIRVGAQTRRSRTAEGAGPNPVWNEVFRFNLLTENDVELEIKDERLMGEDKSLGTATLDLAGVRTTGSEIMQLPVTSRKSKRQHGFISVALRWSPSEAAAASMWGMAAAATCKVGGVPAGNTFQPRLTPRPAPYYGGAVMPVSSCGGYADESDVVIYNMHHGHHHHHHGHHHHHHRRPSYEVVVVREGDEGMVAEIIEELLDD